LLTPIVVNPNCTALPLIKSLYPGGGVGGIGVGVGVGGIGVGVGVGGIGVGVGGIAVGV
jgi:hypothetical protein